MAEINDLDTTDASNTARFPEGQAPSTVNNGARALEGMVARGLKDTIDGCITTGGTTTAYTVAANRSSVAAYYDGFTVCVKWNATCGANPTVNVNSIGDESLYWPDGTQVTTGDLVADARSIIQYDGTNFQLLTIVSPPTGDVVGPGTITDGAYVQFDGTTGKLLKATAETVQEAGAQTIALPAVACTTRTTNGAASATVELATNDVMLNVFDFDAATSEAVQFMVPMPKSWDEGTVTCVFLWTAASGSGDVVWGCRAKALSNDDAIDSSWGTGVTVTDTLTAANDLCITSATSAITIGGTPAAEDLVIFEFYRDAASGSDTLAVDARLIALKIIYTTDTANDA